MSAAIRAALSAIPGYGVVAGVAEAVAGFVLSPIGRVIAVGAVCWWLGAHFQAQRDDLARVAATAADKIAALTAEKRELSEKLERAGRISAGYALQLGLASKAKREVETKGYAVEQKVKSRGDRDRDFTDDELVGLCGILGTAGGECASGSKAR